MRTRWLVVAGLIALTGAAALAKGSKCKIKGLGAAEVKWNQVTYREELMRQLSPGLTWRLGKDGPTRLTIEGMALVSQGTMLLPGNMVLNLRYVSPDEWLLVAFDKRGAEAWKWDTESPGYGLIPTDVGKIPKPGKPAKQLALELRAVTKGTPSRVERAVTTGPTEDDEAFTETSPDLTYEAQARAELEKLPVVELHVRFGPHMALTSFDPVKTKLLKGERERTPSPGDAKPKGKTRVKAKPQKILLHWALHGAVRARTAFLEEHEGELTVGLLEKGGLGGKPEVLVLTGGEMPFLWRVPRAGSVDGGSGDSVEGTRVETKTVPEQVTADLEGNRLTIHLAKVDYVFEL